MAELEARARHKEGCLLYSVAVTALLGAVSAPKLIVAAVGQMLCWFSNQLRRLAFPVLEPRPGVPNMCSNSSLPREDVHAHAILSSSVFTTRCTGPALITCFPALPDFMWIYLYNCRLKKDAQLESCGLSFI